MNLMEAFLKDNLFLDTGAEILYGEDQVNLDFPCRFATVEFELLSSPGLIQIADRIRKDKGFVPTQPLDEFNCQTCDCDAWYDFYVGINDWNGTKSDSCITFVVVNSQSQDNEETYAISLDEREQEFVFSRLDEQCRRHLGKGCLDLLAEARNRMEVEES